MWLGVLLLTSAMALPFAGLLLTSRVTEQRRVARARHADANELAEPTSPDTLGCVRPSGADGPSRWRRVAPRRVPFPHATTPRATRRRLLVALPPRLDGPARSAASPTAPERIGQDSATAAPPRPRTPTGPPWRS